MSKIKTILYSVSTGYFARNLLRTGVVEKLLENPDIRIVIVSPGYEEEEFVLKRCILLKNRMISWML